MARSYELLPASSNQHEHGPYDIYVVGLGMLGQHQLTHEVDFALRRCKEIFVLHYERSLLDYCSTFCEHVTYLSSFYRPGVPREQIYQEIGQRILEAGASNPPVALALYGHPVIFVSPTNVIVEGSKRLRLRAKVLPGISAMDCLFVDLNLDPGVEGLQMYEATDMLLRKRPLQPDVPCLVWQIGAVGNLQYSSEPHSLKPEYLTRLKDYLLQFYPPGHEAVIAVTPVLAIAKPKLVHTEIGRLDEMYEYIGSLDTLYIPALSHRVVKDEEFLRLITEDNAVRAEESGPVSSAPSCARSTSASSQAGSPRG